MDFTKVRRLVITAMFSDDLLLERLVLKGGNALELVHNLVDRGSLDIDLAMANDLEDLADVDKRILTRLRDRFDSEGLIMFDESFEKVPPVGPGDTRPHWGGYRIAFKLISHARAKQLGGKLDQMRVQAYTIGEHSNA